MFVLAASAHAAAPPDFYARILPILQSHCQVCHRPGEIAPMPLVTYAQTRPWAKAIRDAVVARKMPPWLADPRFGHFANDPSLTQHEIDTISAWVAAGSPEGDPKTGPPAPHWTQGWNIGQPDAVLEMARAFHLPAKGDVEYQYIIIPALFPEDKWVQKIEIRPSARNAVHHAVAYVRPRGSDWLRGQPVGVPFGLSLAATKNDVLLVYTPGNSWDEWSPGMAKKIPAGADIVLQMHYTTTGKPEDDRTRIGLVFAQSPPEKAVITLQLNNDRFVIPPGDANYRVQASGTLPNDALLLSLFPHMHLRGKAFEYEIDRLHGAVDTLLRVDHYDFEWQLNYKLAHPLPLHAGTRLVCAGYFDNSANNPRNPDPTAEVRYGEQSWQEMMIGFFDVAVPAAIDKQTFFIRPR